MGKYENVKKTIIETNREAARCMSELGNLAKNCTDSLRYLRQVSRSASIRERYRRDCYYFSDGHYMEGEIETCGKHHKFGYCPCENCNEYLPEFAVKKYVSEHIDEIRKETK